VNKFSKKFSKIEPKVEPIVREGEVESIKGGEEVSRTSQLRV
jgi:hypothetical protein